jgi:hypothetical protein
MSTELYANFAWTVKVNRLVPQSVKMKKNHGGHMSTIKDVSRHGDTNIQVKVSNKKDILEIYEDFHDIFYLEGDKLLHTDLVKHSIPTPALDKNKVINVRLYRLPEAHKEEVNRQIS